MSSFFLNFSENSSTGHNLF